MHTSTFYNFLKRIELTDDSIAATAASDSDDDDATIHRTTK